MFATVFNTNENALIKFNRRIIRKIEIYNISFLKKMQKPTTPGISKLSPIQVLTGPDAA